MLVEIIQYLRKKKNMFDCRINNVDTYSPICFSFLSFLWIFSLHVFIPNYHVLVIPAHEYRRSIGVCFFSEERGLDWGWTKRGGFICVGQPILISHAVFNFRKFQLIVTFRARFRTLGILFCWSSKKWFRELSFPSVSGHIYLSIREEEKMKMLENFSGGEWNTDCFCLRSVLCVVCRMSYNGDTHADIHAVNKTGVSTMFPFHKTNDCNSSSSNKVPRGWRVPVSQLLVITNRLTRLEVDSWLRQHWIMIFRSNSCPWSSFDGTPWDFASHPWVWNFVPLIALRIDVFEIPFRIEDENFGSEMSRWGLRLGHWGFWCVLV